MTPLQGVAAGDLRLDENCFARLEQRVLFRPADIETLMTDREKSEAAGSGAAFRPRLYIRLKSGEEILLYLSERETFTLWAALRKYSVSANVIMDHAETGDVIRFSGENASGEPRLNAILSNWVISLERSYPDAPRPSVLMGLCCTVFSCSRHFLLYARSYAFSSCSGVAR